MSSKSPQEPTHPPTRLSDKQAAERFAHATQGRRGETYVSWVRLDSRGRRQPSRPLVMDYGEQWPLDPNQTSELARALGVRHPRYGCDSRTGRLVPDMLVVTKDTTSVCDVKWQKASDAPEKDGGSHG